MHKTLKHTGLLITTILLLTIWACRKEPGTPAVQMSYPTDMRDSVVGQYFCAHEGYAYLPPGAGPSYDSILGYDTLSLIKVAGDSRLIGILMDKFAFLSSDAGTIIYTGISVGGQHPYLLTYYRAADSIVYSHDYSGVSHRIGDTYYGHRIR